MIFTGYSFIMDAFAPDVAQTWSYIGEVILAVLVLAGIAKMTDHIVREIDGKHLYAKDASPF